MADPLPSLFSLPFSSLFPPLHPLPHNVWSYLWDLVEAAQIVTCFWWVLSRYLSSWGNCYVHLAWRLTFSAKVSISRALYDPSLSLMFTELVTFTVKRVSEFALFGSFSDDWSNQPDIKLLGGLLSFLFPMSTISGQVFKFWWTWHMCNNGDNKFWASALMYHLLTASPFQQRLPASDFLLLAGRASLSHIVLLTSVKPCIFRLFIFILFNCVLLIHVSCSLVLHMSACNRGLKVVSCMRCLSPWVCCLY